MGSRVTEVVAQELGLTEFKEYPPHVSMLGVTSVEIEVGREFLVMKHQLNWIPASENGYRTILLETSIGFRAFERGCFSKQLKISLLHRFVADCEIFFWLLKN